MVNTLRGDLDLIVLFLAGFVAWHFAGIMPASALFLAISVLSNRRDEIEDGKSLLSTWLFYPIGYAPPTLAFLYSFSCPFIGSDIFGLSGVYASIREFLGIQHCWGFDLLGLPIPPLS